MSKYVDKFNGNYVAMCAADGAKSGKVFKNSLCYKLNPLMDLKDRAKLEFIMFGEALEDENFHYTDKQRNAFVAAFMGEF